MCDCPLSDCWTAVARTVDAFRATVSVFTLTIIAFLVLTWMAGFLANSLLSVVESRSTAWHGTAFDDFFVADHILLGEGVRESLSFVTHQLEDSRWSTARKIAYQAQLQEQARLNVDAGFLARVALHFTKGTALLGLLSVFYTYIAATFVSPLGRTLFRAIRPAGGRRRAGDNSASMGQIIIVIVGSSYCHLTPHLPSDARSG